MEERRESTPTFREAALKVHALNLLTLSSSKHAAQLISTLQTYALVPYIIDLGAVSTPHAIP